MFAFPKMEGETIITLKKDLGHGNIIRIDRGFFRAADELIHAQERRRGRIHESVFRVSNGCLLFLVRMYRSSAKRGVHGESPHRLLWDHGRDCSFLYAFYFRKSGRKRASRTHLFYFFLGYRDARAFDGHDFWGRVRIRLQYLAWAWI